MASKWLSSPLARIAFLTGGTVLLTLGINQDENEWIWIGGFSDCLSHLSVLFQPETVARKKLADAGSYPQQGLFFPPS